MKDSRRIIKEILFEQRKLSIGLGGLIVLCVFFSLLTAQLLRILIDRCLLVQNTDKMTLFLALFVFSLLFAQILEIGKSIVLTSLGQKLVHRLRLTMVSKMHRLNILYFTENTGAVISSRIITDVESVSQLFVDGLISLIIDCFRIVGILGSIWLFSAALGMASLVLLPGLIAVTRFFQARLRKAQIANLKELAGVNEHIQESVRNDALIHAFHIEKKMEVRYQRKLKENMQTMEKVNFYDAIFSPVIQLIKTALIAAIVLLAAKQGAVGTLSVGTTAACMELISNLFAPIEALGMEIQNIQKGLSGLTRIDEFLQEPEEAPKIPNQAELILQPNHFEIIFDHVSFSYIQGKPILHDFSAVFHDPDCVSFVGRTGVGKSTLFKLLLGLLVPDEGRITINGIDVSTIDNEEKRRIFGVVQQQFTFIEGTVADQIRLHDESITSSQIEEVMKFVGLHETIVALPLGYQTPVNPQRDFSQGQQQLLTVARALVMQPPILLLDEISAGLDSLSEMRIMNVLLKASEHRLLFSISHRWSGVFDRNRIMDLDTRKNAGKEPDSEFILGHGKDEETEKFAVS